MPRPIDAYAAIDMIDEWLDSVGTVMVGKGLSSYGELIGCIEDTPTLTPPNEPLTLEQLREMKDKPAYLKVFDPLLKSGWHIIKAVTEDKIIFRGWEKVYVPIDGMGIDYNLYRRLPEGEEKNVCN